MLITRRTKQVKAARRYICHLCEKPILFGKYHIVEKCRDEKGFSEVRRHIHCDAMLEAYGRYYSDERYYTEQQVAETLRKENCIYTCDEKQRSECDPRDTFACEICQERILSPSVIGAAKESVRGNICRDSM